TRRWPPSPGWIEGEAARPLPGVCPPVILAPVKMPAPIPGPGRYPRGTAHEIRHPPVDPAVGLPFLSVPGSPCEGGPVLRRLHPGGPGILDGGGLRRGGRGPGRHRFPLSEAQCLGRDVQGGEGVREGRSPGAMTLALSTPPAGRCHG